MELELEDHLLALGKSIKTIEFKYYSVDESTLELLIEGNEKILFDLPLNNQKRPRINSQGIWPNEYSDNIAARIRTAHIQTDVFTDTSEFYRFNNLVHLRLSISNTDAVYEDKDVANLWHVLRDLAGDQLKTVTFDISTVNDTAVEQIKALFNNPHNVVDLKFIERRRTKRSS